MPNDLFLSPLIQYGFAGFCAVLLLILVWLIGKLLSLQRTTTQVVDANTHAIKAVGHATTAAVGTVDDRTRELLDETKALNRRLIARPCIAKDEE